MKKVLVAGVLALVIIGCVLAAGCTSISTTDSGNLNAASGTVTDSPGASNAAVKVWNEKELRAAVAAGGKVTLGANITIDDQLKIENEVILDLNGYDLKSEGDDRVIIVCSTGNLTLNDTDQSYGPGRIKDGEEEGAGVYVDKGGMFTMNAGVITANDGDDNGAGVYVNGGTFIMNGGSITENTADDYGGGVYITNGGKFTMNNGTISNNLADWHDGGGVYLCKDCEFTMNGGSITKNTADNDGGGVFVAGTFTMNNGTILNNLADDDAGGGVFVTGTGTFTMNGSASVNGNVASNEAGGVYVKGTFTMNGGVIRWNDSERMFTTHLHPIICAGVFIEKDATYNKNGGTIFDDVRYQ